MSQCTFIAADVPLREVHDRYTRAMSLREAVKAGVMSGRAARRTGIVPDEPGVVISCSLRPGEDPADNFSLLEFPFARCYCGMDCAVSIEMGFTKTNGSGDMTPEKAERIADYVREVLTRTDAVELWTVWLSGYDPPRIKERRVSLRDFTGADVAELYSASCWPADGPVNLFGGERPTYHRLRVERRAV